MSKYFYDQMYYPCKHGREIIRTGNFDWNPNIIHILIDSSFSVKYSIFI